MGETRIHEMHYGSLLGKIYVRERRRFIHLYDARDDDEVGTNARSPRALTVAVNNNKLELREAASQSAARSRPSRFASNARRLNHPALANAQRRNGALDKFS